MLWCGGAGIALCSHIYFQNDNWNADALALLAHSLEVLHIRFRKANEAAFLFQLFEASRDCGGIVGSANDPRDALAAQEGAPRCRSFAIPPRIGTP